MLATSAFGGLTTQLNRMFRLLHMTAISRNALRCCCAMLPHKPDDLRNETTSYSPGRPSAIRLNQCKLNKVSNGRRQIAKSAAIAKSLHKERTQYQDPSHSKLIAPEKGASSGRTVSSVDRFWARSTWLVSKVDISARFRGCSGIGP
jgi:hypothetical protein